MADYDRDTFWNIEKLIPRKNQTLKMFSTKPKVVDISIDGEVKDDNERRTLTEQTSCSLYESPEEKEYFSDTGLVRRILVRKLQDKFDFHGNFVKAALLYYDFKAPPCEFVQYYSYMPQYAQLNHAQKEYYFYWRSMVRAKKYIKTDYSYFYLYVYEIINLPQKISPKDGIDMLIDIWCAYRDKLPNVDQNMALWIQDYCLIYNLECPMARIRDFVFSSVGASGFTEFYLSDIESLGDSGITSVLSYLSDYDWRAGKYAGGDNREPYARHMIGALRTVISSLFRDGKIFNSQAPLSVMERTAFRSALTTSDVKYRITAEYRPLSCNNTLRALITSTVKYTENKLRALLGVKSRLAVNGFSSEYRELIDSYFSVLFDKVNRERAKAARPEYEIMYEAENTPFSAANADEIERASWGTTARLVSEDEAEEAEDTSVFENQPANFTAEEDTDDDNAGSNTIEFLRAVLGGDTAKMKNIAASCGMLCDALADEINEKLYESVGDIVITLNGDSYELVEDYREDVMEWLSRGTK